MSFGIGFGPGGPPGPAGPQGAQGEQGAVGPSGLGTITMIPTPGVVPPTARDADFVIPDTVGLGRQITYEVQLRCRKNAARSWRVETHLITLSITSGNIIQLNNQQLGNAINSTVTYMWTGTIALAWSTYPEGAGQRVRVTCSGPNNATLPDGCTWMASAIKKHDLGSLI